MNLSDVSRTAILTLIGHVVASEKENIVFNDPIAVLCLERLMSIASTEEKKWIIRQKRMIATPDARAMARRAKTFDEIANRFIAANPQCTVINLACGFDSRFWRIENKDCRYVEIDLPEVVALKKEILKDQLGYELIGCSVLEAAWIDQVTANGNSNFLLLAEGLFMFLPKQDVKNLLQLLAQKFIRSQLVVEMAHEKWTKGFWKMLFALQARVWGLDVALAFGIKNPRDIESYGNGLKVLGDAKGSSIGPIIIVSINAA
ncbi:MAG: class I SAM-dependent methyltransferase [Anaerolineales bacterium]|jgi:O-methyltransferase involved in polyketide biosynthesis